MQPEMVDHVGPQVFDVFLNSPTRFIEQHWDERGSLLA